MIGALQVQNYALFVSHKHPDGHVSYTSSSFPFVSSLHFVIIRLISMSFRLRRRDIHGERSRLIRAFLLVVAVHATMSPFVRKVTATAKFPWWANLRKPSFLQDCASSPMSWNPHRCNNTIIVRTQAYPYLSSTFNLNTTNALCIPTFHFYTLNPYYYSYIYTTRTFLAAYVQ